MHKVRRKHCQGIVRRGLSKFLQWARENNPFVGKSRSYSLTPSRARALRGFARVYENRKWCKSVEFAQISGERNWNFFFLENCRTLTQRMTAMCKWPFIRPRVNLTFCTQSISISYYVAQSYLQVIFRGQDMSVLIFLRAKSSRSVVNHFSA